MKHKLLSILTALALVLSLCPVTAFAAEGDEPDGTAANPWPCGAEGDNVKAWLSDDKTTLTISGTGAMAGYDEPKSQPWYNSRSTITTVVLESGVTTVGSNAFFSCTLLEEVTFEGRETVVWGLAYGGNAD